MSERKCSLFVEFHCRLFQESWLDKNLLKSLLSKNKCFVAGKNAYEKKCFSTELWMIFLNGNYERRFPGGSEGKATACNAGDSGLMPWSGRSAGEGNGHHFSNFAWEIPGTEECGGLQSTGSEQLTPSLFMKQGRAGNIANQCIIHLVQSILRTKVSQGRAIPGFITD